MASRFLRRKSAPSTPLTPLAPPIQKFSSNSTPAVPDSLWFASDFLLGAGMVIIQEETQKVVVIYDTKRKIWFLPKGRKDIGESLEQAALREAYEESGYRVEFLPLYSPTRQPDSPNATKDQYMGPNTEPIYTSIISWSPRENRRREVIDNGGEYLSFYYVGRLPADAVHHKGTGMPDEKNYTTHLLSAEDALARITDRHEGTVIHRAWGLWRKTLEIAKIQQLDKDLHPPETAFGQ